MSSPVGLAVSGLGWIGRKHAELIRAHRDCHLLGLCDVDAARRSVAEQFDVPFYQNIEELLECEHPEAVIIATPNHTHAEIVESCAKWSVHVLIEKPIADTLSAAHRIQHVAHEAGIQVLVGHHRRHSPLIQETRSIVNSGELGRLVGVSMMWALLKPAEYFEVDWRCTRPGGGPSFINLIHELDTLRFICGEIGQVCALSGSSIRQLDVEDSLSITLSFNNGAMGSVFASDTAASPWSYEATTAENPYYFHADQNCYHFFGTTGSLAFPRMELWRYVNESHASWQHPMTMSRHEVMPTDPLERQLEHFCKVIRDQEEPIIDAREGAQSLAVALAVLESIQQQTPVEIPEA